MKKVLKNVLILFFVFFATINVYAKEGWIKEDNNQYFYENDEKVYGFKTIDDIKYFFSYMNGALKKGWQSLDGNTWYQDENGVVLAGLQKIDGNIYFFNNDTSFLVKGFQEIDDDTYFFSYMNGSLKYGLQSIDGKYWYQDSDGKVVKNSWITNNGNTYYFGEDGYQVRGFQTINEELYFFSYVNGALKYGFQGIDGKYWYQNNQGVVQQNKWITINGNEYYFGEDGYQVRGFKNIDGLLYFFSYNNGALKYGWQSLDGNTWYQNKDGIVVTGWQKIDKEKYYFNDEGYMQKGFQVIDEEKYFLSYANGALKYGWQGLNGDYWYQDSDGKLLTGIHTVDGRDYAFNNEGILQGFKTENGKLYYYDPDGTQAKGVQYMIGSFWKYNEITGIFEKNVREMRVIDVSQWKGNIDWKKVKKSGLVDAVVLRLGSGEQGLDIRFLQNIKALNSLGIPYTVYLFSHATNEEEALKESDFLVSTIKNNDVRIASHLFSIFYDLESWNIESTGKNSDTISKDMYGKIIKKLVENTESKLKIKTRVYASKYYIETRFPQNMQQYATWVAQWGPKLTYKGPYEGWQYSSTGTIPGIDGPVDLSLFYY